MVLMAGMAAMALGLETGAAVRFEYTPLAGDHRRFQIPFREAEPRYWISRRGADGRWVIVHKLGAPDPRNALQSSQTLPLPAGVYKIHVRESGAGRSHSGLRPVPALTGFTIEAGDWIIVQCDAAGEARCAASLHEGFSLYR
ncbi:hypothetical protein F1654_07925 [Alkalicaulis satelles]|uniref:Uncharacterized protein n=1 Tax=Alkalicaulis satelles TaxID=2609175 RepID=A0A5M6ZNB1_9PROT|nr:hypothetical protein [Alkalicaulis satelles]KAA5803721.1 hypothetical protein F1654_07925 [Alkalicaulis satelles]